ncbi:MAG: hypothetical protein V3R49_04165 [Gammaproteobacteria bacterium]
MEPTFSDFIKQREIHFRSLNPNANDARDAMLLLMEINGIEDIRALTQDCLQVRYDLRTITLEVIETGLQEVGFHLDNSLLFKFKRALFYYTEETQLVNMGQLHDQASSTLDIFINCYHQRQHGCRDGRPPHLRQYS